MSPMILAHWGQLVSESKLSGISSSLTVELAISTSPVATASATVLLWSPITPMSDLEAPGPWDAKRG